MILGPSELTVTLDDQEFVSWENRAVSKESYRLTA